MKDLYLYFTMGYPDMDTLERFISLINADKVNGIEIGFPSMDPKYDGPEIRKSHSSAVDPGRERMLEFLKILGMKNIPLYSLQYYSDICSDIEENLAILRESGFSGIIVPDLTTDYFKDSEKVIDHIEESGLDFIPFFSASSPDRVIARQCSLTSSWIYYGIQPSTGINMPMDMAPGVQRIRSIAGNRKMIFGFGIRNEDHVREAVRNGADGIAIGTILLKYLESNDKNGFIDLVERMRVALNDNS
ncbi:MAG: tryptophan synthase subunit alpha [Candidatus Thermoplasmatota archaeon]|nr:tryptophan synthase subunit alpha [Candidatus Thermoplasmatota archaeon]MCL5665261.1 tryptophan synthase subunit alpha [Candidatus Thermoplasmatota archaeon]